MHGSETGKERRHHQEDERETWESRIGKGCRTLYDCNSIIDTSIGGKKTIISNLVP